MWLNVGREIDDKVVTRCEQNTQTHLIETKRNAILNDQLATLPIFQIIFQRLLLSYENSISTLLFG